ncbi:bifunctional DNA primase/helicase, partial [Pseudomonas syringae]
QGTVKAKMMLAVIRYCAEKLKVNHFVIDSLMKCGIGEDDYNGQKAFLDSLTSIARDTGIHLHLVAHSRKAKDGYTLP